MTKIAIASCLLLLAGCAGMQTVEQERQTLSSGFIGCPPAEIAVTNSAQYTWTSSCRGRTFYCTVSPQASCKEAIKAPA